MTSIVPDVLIEGVENAIRRPETLIGHMDGRMLYDNRSDVALVIFSPNFCHTRISDLIYKTDYAGD